MILLRNGSVLLLFVLFVTPLLSQNIEGKLENMSRWIKTTKETLPQEVYSHVTKANKIKLRNVFDRYHDKTIVNDTLFVEAVDEWSYIYPIFEEPQSQIGIYDSIILIDEQYNSYIDLFESFSSRIKQIEQAEYYNLKHDYFNAYDMDGHFEQLSVEYKKLLNYFALKYSVDKLIVNKYAISANDTVYITICDRNSIRLKSDNINDERIKVRLLKAKFGGKSYYDGQVRRIIVYVKDRNDINDFLVFILYHEIAHHKSNTVLANDTEGKNKIQLENNADCLATELLLNMDIALGAFVIGAATENLEKKNIKGVPYTSENTLARSIIIKDCFSSIIDPE